MVDWGLSLRAPYYWPASSFNKLTPKSIYDERTSIVSEVSNAMGIKSTPSNYKTLVKWGELNLKYLESNEHDSE
jgi:hypothetical protein